MSRIYVCSLKYGSFWRLGDVGVDNEGYAEYLGLTAGTTRYFSYVTGTGNVDGGETDRQIVLVDLKSRKVLLSRSPQRGGGGASVTALAVTAKGRLGWITRTSEANPDPAGPKEIDTSQVFLRSGSSAELVADRPEIDPYFLRFDRDGKKLIWSSSVESIATK